MMISPTTVVKSVDPDFSKLPKLGHWIFFDGRTLQITVKGEVKIQKAEKVSNWMIVNFGGYQDALLNTDKLSSALGFSVGKTIDVVVKNLVTSLMNLKYADAIDTLLRSVKDPTTVDDKTLEFAKSLFNEDFCNYQCIKAQFFKSKKPITLFAFKHFGSSELTIIRTDNAKLLEKTNYSYVLKVQDITKKCFVVLKCPALNHFETNVQALLREENSLDRISYQEINKNNQQPIGVEFQREYFDDIPLMEIVNEPTQVIGNVMLKPYFECGDLENFLGQQPFKTLESRLDGFFQLVIRLAKWEKSNESNIDIGPENTFISRSKDEGYFDFKMSVTDLKTSKEIETQATNKELEVRLKTRTVPYIDYFMINEYISQLRREKVDDVKQLINDYINLRKKIAVYELATNLNVILLNAKQGVAFEDKRVINGQSFIFSDINKQYLNKVAFEKMGYEFMYDILKAMLQPAERRITATEVLKTSYQKIKEQFKLPKRFEKYDVMVKEILA